MTNKREEIAKEINGLLYYLECEEDMEMMAVTIADWHIAEQRKLLEEIRKKLMPVLPMGSAQGYTNEVIDRKLQELNT